MSINVTKKFTNPVPLKPDIAAKQRNISPTPIIGFTPNRRMKWPVKKDGIDIASTCVITTSAALLWLNPHPTIANGAEVIIRFIRAYEIIPQIIAVRIGAVVRIWPRFLKLLVGAVILGFKGILKKIKMAGPNIFRIIIVT